MTQRNDPGDDLSRIASVAYTRSYRAKYLRITLRPDRSVTVTIPRHASLDEARRFLQLKINWILKKLQAMRLQEHAPPSPDLNSAELKNAQESLFRRLDEFSRQYNLPYHRATFRCQKTRWASCSGKNNINLNINMAFLPTHLQDYILRHELTHIQVKNHSRRFWTQLDAYCDGRAKALAKELKQYKMKLQA
jgi:predicted metal-dependent hydrolase